MFTGLSYVHFIHSLTVVNRKNQPEQWILLEQRE